MDQGNTGDIVIAADLELSGAYADVGTTYQRALQMKVQQVNAAGGVLGHKLRLDARDNRSDPTLSVANVNTFVNDNDLGGIITGWSGDGLRSVAKTVNDKGIPTVSLSPATEAAKPISDRKYIFKIGPNADDDAAVLASQLKDDKMASVAVVATSDSAGNDAMTSLKQALDKADIKITDKQQFQATDTDVSQPATLAVARHPDALVISALSSRALAAARAARQAGFSGRIYFDQPAAGELFLSGMSAQEANGIAMVATQSMVIDDVIATNPANVGRRQWFNDYTAQYGNFSEYSTYAADAVQALVNGLIAAGGAGNHDTARDVIESSHFDGLSGGISMTPENHSGLTPQALTVLVARGDRWRRA